MKSDQLQMKRLPSTKLTHAHVNRINSTFVPSAAFEHAISVLQRFKMARIVLTRSYGSC